MIQNSASSHSPSLHKEEYMTVCKGHSEDCILCHENLTPVTPTAFLSSAIRFFMCFLRSSHQLNFLWHFLFIFFFTPHSEGSAPTLPVWCLVHTLFNIMNPAAACCGPLTCEGACIFSGSPVVSMGRRAAGSHCAGTGSTDSTKDRIVIQQ